MGAALCTLLLIDGLRAMGITTASPFTRIPSTTLRQSRTSKYTQESHAYLLAIPPILESFRFLDEKDNEHEIFS